MATYYSYDDIHKIDAWQDNNIMLTLTQGEGLDGEVGSNTYVKRPTFQLKDERGVISIPTTGARLELAFTRRDGTTGSLGSNEITTSDGENGIVSFTVKPNLTSVVGKVKGEIRLITSNAVIKFYGVNFWVNKGVSNQDAIDSVEFDDLTKAFQELVRITPEGTAVLDTLDENGELPTNGTHPVASGVLKEYLKGHYVRSESVNDSAIDTANDQRTIYIHNVGGSVRGLVFFVGYNNYVEVTTVIQYRFCKGGKVEFRTGTVKSPVTTPNTYIWDKTYNENWNPIGSAQNIQDKAVTKAKLGDDVIAELDGSSVTIINAETVPESANWDGEIPTTYAGQTGEKGEIAFWNGELWYLYNVATLGQTTYYHWDKVAVTEDLEAKMDLAPLNPTAEQIAALPSGQLYSDVNAGTVNIKNGVQLLGVLSNGSNPEYGSTKGELGQISYYAGKMYQCFGLNPQGTAYVWKLMSYADSDVIKARFSTTGPSGDFVITSSTTLYEIGRLFRKYRCVKVEITNQYGTPTGYVCWITTVTGNNYENLSAFMLPSISGTSSPVYERIHFLVQNGDSSDDTLRLVTKYVYPPYEEYYTKTEIDDMIGDIESLLSEV